MPRRRACISYHPGHRVHWIATRHAWDHSGITGHLALEHDTVMFEPHHGRPRPVFTHRPHADGLGEAALHGTTATLIPEVHLLQASTHGGCRWFNVSKTPSSPAPARNVVSSKDGTSGLGGRAH